MAQGQIVQKITVDLDKLAADAGATVAQARNEFVNRLAVEVVENTPVISGNLRRNWFLSSTLTGNSGSSAGETTAGLATATLARLSGEAAALASLDGSIYLLNGANYAIYVEARRQFLAKVLARASAIAADVVIEIRNIKATGIP